MLRSKHEQQPKAWLSLHGECQDNDTETKRFRGRAVILHANCFLSTRNWLLSWS